jgi:hypothetical protein
MEMDCGTIRVGIFTEKLSHPATRKKIAVTLFTLQKALTFTGKCLTSKRVLNKTDERATVALNKLPFHKPTT